MEIAKKLVHNEVRVGGGTGSPLHGAICKLLGANVKRYRELGGWGQMDVAIAAEVTPQTIYNLEQGRGFSHTTLYKVAAALDIDIEFLLPTLSDVCVELDKV